MAKNKKVNVNGGFLGKSRRFVRAAIFMSLFAIAGLAFLLQSQAASQPSVRFVVFCATDSCHGNTSEVQDRAKKVRSWYKNRLGDGRTFRLLQTKKVVGSHSAAWYRAYGGYSAQTTFNKLQNSEYKKLYESNVKTVVILGFRSMDRCGAGGGWLAVVDPFRGCSSFQTSVYAHELAHTWGLGHRTDGSLMHDPVACNARTLANCPLNSEQRAYLLNSRSSWFPSPATASASGYDSDVVPDDGTSYQDPVQMVEYFHDGNKDSFYTVKRNDSLYANYGYRYLGHVAHVLSGPDDNLAAFKRYYNYGNKHHFYTVKPETACFGGPIESCGYTYIGIEGYVYLRQPAYTVQFKNYVNGYKNHYYTYHPQNVCFGGPIENCGYSFWTNVGYVYL